MWQYETFNKITLNKLKSGTKYATKITLKLLSNVIQNTNDETNLSHQILLSNRQVLKLCKTFANNS